MANCMFKLLLYMCTKYWYRGILSKAGVLEKVRSISDNEKDRNNVKKKCYSKRSEKSY